MENGKLKKTKEKSLGVLGFFRLHGGGLMRWLVLAVFATLAAAAANFLIPQVIRFVVDSVIGDEASLLPGFLQGAFSGLKEGGDVFATLVWCAVAVVAFAVAAGLCTFISRMAMATGTERFSRRLRDRLYSHIQRLPFSWQVENQTGDTIQRCTSDLEVVHGFAAQQLLEVVRTVALILVALGLMFSMNLKLALISLAFIPVILGYCLFFYSRVAKRFLAADEAEGELTAKVQENLTGVRVVRAFGRERYELEHFDRFNDRFAALWIKLGRTLSLFWASGDFASGMQILTVTALGAYMAATGEMTLGEFQAFVWYNGTLAWPIRSLGRTLAEMSKTGVSANRIQEILDAQEEPAEPDAQTPDLRRDIRFENVTFAYGNKAVLRDLSFTIPAGSTFGILGATGSGKSTITYLLNRLYELPEGQGHIYYGEIDVRDIDRSWLRHNVGLVLQEPYLYSRTIEENIAIAAPDGVDHHEGVRTAARIAVVDEAIGEFAKGYQTVVGERGVTLSGGQKQRVAIARTLMTKAPVMVFDDSMSAVDLETDAKIRRALCGGDMDATVILISHRINTLMTADAILVLEDGRAVQLGTHAQLITTPGPYKRIYDMQSEAAADAGETLENLARQGVCPPGGEEVPGRG